MKIHEIVVLGIVCLAATACSRPSEILSLPEPAMVTPSQLNSDPDLYHQQEVVISGFVLLSSGSHNIFESRELFEEYEQKLQSGNYLDPNEFDKYCITIANPDRLWADPEKFRRKTVVFKGVFIKDYLREDRIDLGACSKTAIVID